MKPWEKYSQPVTPAITKPWEKFQEKPKTFKQKAGEYGLKVAEDIGQVGKSFSPQGAEAFVRALTEATQSDIAKLRKLKLPEKPSEDIISIPGLKKSALVQMGLGMARPILHPIESIKEGKLASTAIAWVPFLKGVKGMFKTIPKKMPVSELIAGKLERSTVENVAKNQYVQKGMTIFAKEDLNDVVNNATEATIKARENIAKAQNYIYQKAGITDDMMMPKERTTEALNNIKTEVNKFSDLAIGENKKLASQAKELVNDLQSKSATLNFGQIKSLTRQIYDLADANVTDTGKYTEVGRLYKQIGAELTKVKKSILQIAEASEKYSQLMEAEDVLRDTLRLDRVNGEQTLPLKIIRRFKDAEHGQFKKQLEQSNEIIKKNADIFKENPETADMINEYGNADFVDKIKLTQALHDVTTKRAVTPTGVGRIPGLAYLIRGTKIGDPLAQMVMLKNAIKIGIVKPEMVSKDVPVSQSIFGGKAFSQLRGLRELTGLPPIPIAATSAIAGVVQRGAKAKEKK